MLGVEQEREEGEEKMKTNRGFELQIFLDDYNKECSIQESSCIGHIWLGIAHDELKIMLKDKPELLEAVKNLTTDYPECNSWGWCTVPLPKDSLVERRMHLNREQAKELAKKLNYFAKHGRLKTEEK